ncbi:MAG: NgoFVII family restriction endonuclease [Emcibacteraceae bacterium]|nr:NgoFVII family restriction endonuclease [Emcibacteraceae bacterium]
MTDKQTLSLLITQGKERDTPLASGINWGQRKGRNGNQAYLSVTSDIQRSNFFPERGEEFLLRWDDGKEMICVRAQDKGKAIQTTKNNSILGEYLRHRLDVEGKTRVLRFHLEKYGRTDIDIFRVEKNIYFADFSV